MQALSLRAERRPLPPPPIEPHQSRVPGGIALSSVLRSSGKSSWREVDWPQVQAEIDELPSGELDVNAELVRNGHAWVYKKYAKDPALYQIENEAKTAERGLWGLAESERVPPWEWRRSKRK